MTSSNIFFDFWNSQKEREALLRRVDQLRLDPSQLKQLLDNEGIRAELQNTRMASLLPPVGTEVFRRFTRASLEEIERCRTEGAANNRLKPAIHLEAAKPLPFVYGNPSPQLLNTPLEELDPFHQSEKTFIVLDKDNIIHRFNAESSCYLLSPFSPVRTFAIKILLKSWFRFFILLTVLTNLVWGWTGQCIFSAIYTLEAIVKVVCRGFCLGRFTFLRDPWNWLDLMVIITRFLTCFLNLGKASVLTTVCLYLKLIGVSPGMRKTAGALIQSVKKLAGVFVLTMFGLSILALIGLQLFMGTLRSKCVMISFPSNMTNISFTVSNAIDFQTYTDNPVNYYHLPGHMDPLLCGNGSNAGACPEGYSCLRSGLNPNYGFTSFDSFGWSLLSLFRLMTQDYWEDLFQMVLRAVGKTYVIVFAFVFLPGGFCLISLILAAVAVVFVDQDKAGITEAKQKEEEFHHILEVMKSRDKEDEKTSIGAKLSEKQEEASQKKSSTADGKHQEETESELHHSLCSPCWYAFANLFLKWNCCGCWRWFKKQLQTFVLNPFFDLGIFICIILNTIFMAMEHYPMIEAFYQIILSAALAFTMIFIVEMILRLLAMDPYGYFKVGWNIFDFIIITGSILDLFQMNFSLLKICSLLRVFRLARWWPTFNLWMKIIWTSVKSLRNLTLILFIMVWMFSIVGLQLLGEDYTANIHHIPAYKELPYWHMGDFFHVFLIVVRILCGEWIETLWDCMATSGQTTCLIFYFIVLVIGSLLILNLFLALLLSSVCGNYLVSAEKKPNNIQIAINRIKKALGTRICRDNTAADSKDKECVALNVVTSDQNIRSSGAPIAEAELEFKTPENEKEQEKTQQCDIEQKPSEVQQDQDVENHKRNTPEACCCDSCYHCCPFLDVDISQGTGRVWSIFRTACLFIAQHKYFEIFIIFIILLSSIALVFEDVHLLQNQRIQVALDKADQVFACLFLLEMGIKWIALGLKKYFSSFWCWLDFLILAVSLMAITAGILGCTELGAGLSLRTLRTLRPLRALSRFKGPRVVLETLAVSLWPMWNVLLVILYVWLIFNIMGVNMFAGRFFYCYNETEGTIFHSEVVNNKTDCLSLYQQNVTEVLWMNKYVNFDGVGIGYLALLQVATFKGWLDIMYSAVDSRGVEDQPAYEANLYMYIYFIWFLFFGCFFTFNLFFRVFMDMLNLQRYKFGGKHFFMTEEQQKYSRSMMRLFSRKPVKSGPRPQNQCQARLFDLVTNPFFEVAMVVLIYMNMVTLMVDSDQQSMRKEQVLYWLRQIFILIFFIEFLLKIISLGKHYITSAWNILDFVILVVSIVGLFIADLSEKYFISPVFFPMFRLARVCRILHLFHCTRMIRKLLLAFVMSLPALVNICFLLFVLIFTYSVFGMLNFADVKNEGMLDDVFNFNTFVNSLICMFVITTKAGWDGVLISLINKDCNPNINNPGSTITGNCVSPEVGIIFCTSFVLLSLLLVVQLYIVVILETFNTEDTEHLSDDDLQMFCKTWKEFDPHTSQVIQYSQLSDLCDSLQKPLRISKPNNIKLAQMDLPLLPEDKIHCLDILMALTAQAFGEPGERDLLKARMEETLRTISCPRKTLQDDEGTVVEVKADASGV